MIIFTLEQQANKWIKAMEGTDLTVVDLNTKDFLRQMGNCIQYGLPCLLQVQRSTFVDSNTADTVNSCPKSSCCHPCVFCNYMVCFKCLKLRIPKIIQNPQGLGSRSHPTKTGCHF